jgi:hypothetical protein
LFASTGKPVGDFFESNMGQGGTPATASESNTGQVSSSFTAAAAALSKADEAMYIYTIDPFPFPLPFVLDLQAHGQQWVEVVRQEAFMQRHATMQILCDCWATQRTNIRWMRHTFKTAVVDTPSLHLVRHQPRAKETPSMYIYTNLLDSNMIHNTDYFCVLKTKGVRR